MLLILPKICSKVINSVFDTRCTVDTLDVVHTGGHAVAISEIHGVSYPIYKYLRKCS